MPFRKLIERLLGQVVILRYHSLQTTIQKDVLLHRFTNNGTLHYIDSLPNGLKEGDVQSDKIERITPLPQIEQILWKIQYV